MGILDRLRRREADPELDPRAVDAELEAWNAQAQAQQAARLTREEAEGIALDFVKSALPHILSERRNAWSVEDLVKAAAAGKLDMVGPVPQASAYRFDPLDPRQQMAPETYSTHPGTFGVHYDVLRELARHPIMSSVIGTRVNQVAEFAVPQADRYSIGYRIVQRDKDAPATAKTRKRAREISTWLQTCGDPRLTEDTYTFEAFLRELVRDSLIFDQACFEVVPTRKGDRLAGFFAVDASTIRRAMLTPEERAQGRRTLKRGQTAFVQVIQNRVVARFAPEQLMFGIRRPRTDVRVNGYGFPELEELITTIARLIAAELYNGANFTNGAHATGILAVTSRMDSTTWGAFQKALRSHLQGPHNAHKLTALQLNPDSKDDVKLLNLTNNNREMEFMQWMGFLLKEALAVFQMDPAEVNYAFGNEGQRSALSAGGPGERIIASRERGLRPLLRSVQTWINAGIISKIDPDYELEFAGLDSEDEKSRIDNDVKAVKAFMTVNEVRAAHDLEELEDPAANMILDPTYVSASQQAAAAAQQQQAAPGDEGPMPDEEGDQGDQGEMPEDVDFGDLFGPVNKSLTQPRRITAEV